MNIITVESAAHLRELCDAAAADPAGSVVCFDLVAGDEPDDGVELDLVSYDPALPTADVPADVVERLPAPAAMPVVHDADAVDDMIGAHRAGAAAARAAWSMGFRGEPSIADATGDCVMVLRGHYLPTEGETLRVALASYQRTREVLRAQSGGAL